MLIKAGLQELAVAVAKSWVPWPAWLEQLMGLVTPFTRTLPEQWKEEFLFTTPSSKAMDRVRIL